MKKNLKGLFIMGFCACLCVGYFFYLNYRGGENSKVLTETEEVIGRNLENTYPSTPREVVKFYNRILTCIYNGESTEKEIEDLGKQARILYDEETLAGTTVEEQIKNIQQELATYEKDDKKIVNVSIATSQDVERKKINGEECAYVESSYYIKGNESSGRVAQTYILRKDSEGKWKILGYYSNQKQSGSME